MVIFATMLVFDLACGGPRPAPALRPTVERVDRIVTPTEMADALTFYRNMISRLETVDLNSKDAVSASLGVRFVRDPVYQRGGLYRHWVAMVPAAPHRPATRIEYLEGRVPHSVQIIPLGWRSTQAEFIAIYPSMSLRPDTAFSGPPEVEFSLPGPGNEVRLFFGHVEPHRLRAMFFRSRRAPGTATDR